MTLTRSQSEVCRTGSEELRRLRKRVPIIIEQDANSGGFKMAQPVKVENLRRLCGIKRRRTRGKNIDGDSADSRRFGDSRDFIVSRNISASSGTATNDLQTSALASSEAQSGTSSGAALTEGISAALEEVVVVEDDEETEESFHTDVDSSLDDDSGLTSSGSSGLGEEDDYQDSLASLSDDSDESRDETTQKLVAAVSAMFPSGSDGASAKEYRAKAQQLLVAYYEEQESLSDTSWLTGTLLDLMFYRFAVLYPKVHFLPTEFAALHLPSAQKNLTLKQGMPVRDLLGRPLTFDRSTPIVFAINIANRHWNLIRVQHMPKPELQLYEPLGKPAARRGRSSGHVSLRYVPLAVIEWLDCFWPHEESWLRKSVSAITKRHQFTGFDCGVACLLYAEKCGQGQDRDQINEWTNQMDITEMRAELRKHIPNPPANS